MPNLDTALGELNTVLKIAVKILPGETQDEKKAAVGQYFDPKLAELLTAHGVSATVAGWIVSLFDLAVSSLIAAEFATA